MEPQPTRSTAAVVDTAVFDKLSLLDRFLPVWIGAAMLGGVLLGRLVPGVGDVLEALKIDTVSVPIAVGLLVMMYPPLAKVRYSKLGEVTADRRLAGGHLTGPQLDRRSSADVRTRVDVPA